MPNQINLAAVGRKVSKSIAVRDEKSKNAVVIKPVYKKNIPDAMGNYILK